MFMLCGKRIIGLARDGPTYYFSLFQSLILTLANALAVSRSATVGVLTIYFYLRFQTPNIVPTKKSALNVTVVQKSR